MQNKTKKIITLGSMIAFPLASISTLSMSLNENIGNDQYTSIVIDGKKMFFKNNNEVIDYIMSNKINVDQKLMIGNIEYIDRNNGVIDGSALIDYINDDSHVQPAYKMMNGKYTRSREKAIKSFLGRTHLVPQYFDGINYHEGNSIGLKNAKNAILSRQKEVMVPFYDVKLSESDSIRINPFSKTDITALQDKALDIYKSNKDDDNENKPGTNNVTDMYLFPAKDGGKVGVLPSDPNKGITIKDIFGGKDIQTKLTNWFKSKITFDFEVKLDDPNDTPYRIRLSDEWDGKTIKKEFDDEVKDKGGISSDEKSMSFKDISYDYYETHKKDFAAFLTHSDFWKTFKTGYNSGSTQWSTWAKARNKNNFFGATMYIENIYPDNKWGTSGWDVVLNHNWGSVDNFSTKATLTPKIKNPETLTVDCFLDFLDSENSNNGNDIYSRLSTDFKGKIMKNIILNGFDNLVGKFKGTIGKYLKSVPSDENSSNKDSGPIKQGNMKTYDPEDHRKIGKNKPKDWKIKKVVFIDGITDSENPVQITQYNKELNKLEINIHNNTLIQDSTKPELLKTLIKENQSDIKKILMVNKTPVDLISGSSSVHSEIYNKIKVEPNLGIYTFSDKNNIWSSDLFNTKPSSKDFTKKYILNKNIQHTIDSSDFADIKANDDYSKQVPLLMFNAFDNLVINKLPKQQYAQIKISKILASKEAGIKSLNKIFLTEFFNSDKSIKDRKIEINQDFFEPGLVYVIYNDNDEIIDEFKPKNSNIRFDDKDTIEHNAKAILSDRIRKSTKLFFVKDKTGNWTDQPISNKPTMVYNITWENKNYSFKNFSNVKTFIKEWVKTHSKTFVVKG